MNSNALRRLSNLTLKSCLGCNSWWPLIDLYCETCWEARVDKAMFPSLREHKKGFGYRCLWNWNPHNDHWVRPMVYSLKGGRARWAWQRLARITSQNLLHSVGEGRMNPLFTPAPPTKRGQADHAFYFAEALADYWQAPMFLGLGRSKGSPQKAKGKIQRLHQQVEVLAHIPRDHQGPVIFVDDILTTGGTALGVRRALGNPLNFQAWVVFERQSLLG